MAWSPDDAMICFVSGPSLGSQLFISNENRSQKKRCRFIAIVPEQSFSDTDAPPHHPLPPSPQRED